MTPPISLRPARKSDEPFFYDVFKSVRGPEFAVLGLHPEQLEMLMKQQYEARTGSYEAQFPDSGNSVVLSGETPIGQFWVFRTPEEFLVVDIALMPDHRGTGVGGALMKQFMAEADAAAVPVRVTVATNNPGSLRFHQRLGFRITSQDEMYYTMEYRGAQ
jgi:ribosomal protein S18 acetylase RimI-like enzyme